MSTDIVVQLQLWIQYTGQPAARLRAIQARGVQISDFEIHEWNAFFKTSLQRLDLICPVEPVNIDIKCGAAQLRGRWAWQHVTYPNCLKMLQARLMLLPQDIMDHHHVALVVYRDNMQALVVPERYKRMAVAPIPLRSYIEVESVAKKLHFLEERFNLKSEYLRAIVERFPNYTVQQIFDDFKLSIQLKPPFAVETYGPGLRTSSALTVADVVPGGHSGHQITPTPVSYPIPAVAIAALNLRQAQMAAARAGTAPNIPPNAHKMMLGIPKAQPHQTETVIATPVNLSDNNVVPMKKIDTGVQVSIAEEEIASLRSALAKETVARVEAAYNSEQATDAYQKEHAERLRLESKLQDVKEELQAIRQEDNTPFVVPAMMDAFARLVELGGEMAETRPFDSLES